MKLSRIFDVLSRREANAQRAAQKAAQLEQERFAAEEKDKEAELRKIIDSAQKLIHQHQLLDPDVYGSDKALNDWLFYLHGCGIDGGRYGELRRLYPNDSRQYTEGSKLHDETLRLGQVYVDAVRNWHEKYDIPRIEYSISDTSVQLARDYIAAYSPPNSPPKPSMKNSLPDSLMPSMAELIEAAQVRIAHNSSVIIFERASNDKENLAPVKEDQRTTLQVLNTLTTGDHGQLIEQVRRELARYFKGTADKPTTWLAELPESYWEKVTQALRPTKPPNTTKPPEASA